MEPEVQSSSESNPEMIMFDQHRSKHSYQTAYPWYQHTTKKIEDSILRMHNQAIDFYLYISPEKDPNKIKLYEDVFKKVEDTMMDLKVVSSFFKNRLYLKDTELDIYILVDDLNLQKKQQIVTRLLELSSLAQIETAHLKYQTYEYELQLQGVPCIIRLLDSKPWAEYLSLIDDSISKIVELKFLYMIVSCMVRQRWWHTNIRPYMIFGLLSVFFHERRKMKTRNLSENIIKFLQYYGVGPFQERKITYLGKGRYELTQEGQGPTSFSFWIGGINIVNPFLKDLFGFIRNRYRLVANYNYDEEQSIIGGLVNPSQQQFSY